MIKPTDDTIDAPQMVAHVCVRGEWMPTSCVRFLDIEEDSQGFDVMTFEFEGKQFESYVTVREIQP